ncbi:MAG: hypothetical protein ACD_73C00110G0003 [uncultured bacterium]|nr:MAG: hypothetical protein ACD_73C00110G0003 [uncultured bacterium]
MAEEFKDAMEYIWERVPKTKEGLIHYLPGDIPYLYRNGFVDTRQYDYKIWKAAFEDCLQSDGSYLVSKEKFFSLRHFRYEGPVFKPFDPNKVRIGEWVDADLQKLYDLSIKPSSGVTEDIFWNSVKALKDQGFVKNGNLLVNETVKKQLSYLIERFPSPRRRLEKEVDRLRTERETEFRAVTENRNSSTFVAGKFASEDKIEKFKNLEKKVAVTKTLPQPKGKEVDLKKLRKPTRKISG